MDYVTKSSTKVKCGEKKVLDSERKLQELHSDTFILTFPALFFFQHESPLKSTRSTSKSSLGHITRNELVVTQMIFFVYFKRQVVQGELDFFFQSPQKIKLSLFSVRLTREKQIDKKKERQSQERTKEFQYSKLMEMPVKLSTPQNWTWGKKRVKSIEFSSPGRGFDLNASIKIYGMKILRLSL